MTKRVKTHLPVLKKLRKCSAKQRRALLESGGKPLQLCLQECAINILNGNVPLSKVQYTRLRKHRKHLRDLSKSTTSQKKKLSIEQKGGFIAGLLAPILASVVSGLVKR